MRTKSYKYRLKLLLLILIVICFIGCRESNVIEKKYIDEKDIFNQTEETYLVYFTNDEEKDLNLIDAYCNSTEREKLEYQVYIVKLNEDSLIYRDYDGIDGEGSTGKSKVSDISKYEELYISNIPTVIKVTDNARLVGDSNQEIINYFNGLISPYEIDYDLDGGKFSSKVNDEFHEANTYELPVPEKKDYIFLGFVDENNDYINELESKDYSLKAVWTERYEYETIKDSEVLTREEDNYLLYVMKDNCSYCEKTKDSVLRYIYLQKNVYKDAPKLYVVNITGSKILSKPTPTLMEVHTEGNVKVSNSLCEGATKVKNELNKILISGKKNYTISVNYGEETKTYEFTEWQEPTLPNYEKEGFLLVGYEENGKFIEKLSKKDYMLNAVFVEEKYETIKDSEIFSQNSNHYLVYFLRDECTYCDKIKIDVIRYQYLTSLEEYNKSLKLYVVNLRTNDYVSPIFRNHESGNSFVNNMTKWDELYISSTPTLIEVKNGTSYLLEVGSTKVVNALDNCLVSESEEFNNKTYTISFDLAYDTDEKLEELKYYEWQTASSLPTPEREGFLFMGWLLDETVVTSISGKDATLKAKWVSRDSYKEISDNEVFNQKPNRYLVFFKKDGCTYCERIENDIYNYGAKILEDDYKNSLQLFIVNLKTGGYTSPIISNKNYDDTHVDGVTDWKDLYVPSTPTLIEVYVQNGVSTAKLVAIGSTKILKALEENLVKNGTPVGEKKSYKIEIDYGYGNIIEIFEKFENSNFELPVLNRDGYVFVGYEENGELVSEITNKDYKLKAVWKGIDDVIVIEDKDIFNQNDNEYYVLFVEKGSNTYTTIMEIALKYQYNLNQEIPLYVVDVKDSVIFRSYSGTDGEGYNNKFFIKNATDWDDLYIYATPSMIKVTKGETIQAAYLNCHLKDVKKFLENLLK